MLLSHAKGFIPLVVKASVPQTIFLKSHFTLLVWDLKWFVYTLVFVTGINTNLNRTTKKLDCVFKVKDEEKYSIYTQICKTLQLYPSQQGSPQ